MTQSEEIKKMLEKMVADKNRIKDETDRKELISATAKKIMDSISPEDKKGMIGDIGNGIIKSLDPLLAEITKQSRLTNEELKKILEEIKLPEPNINYQPPEVIVPDIKIPDIKIPEIKIPKIEIPDIKMPHEMDIKGWVNLMGYDKGFFHNPLPVQIRDANGKPIDFGGSITQILGAGGGKHDFYTIKGFSQSAYAELMNADGRLRVSMETGSTGLTDTELRALSVPISQVSGSIWSTAVIDIFGSTAATNVFNADNRIKVSVETGGSGLTDAELRATAVPVSQVSGVRWSTEATQGTSPWVVSATDLDVRDLANVTDSVSVYQVSGHKWSTEATQAGTWNIATVTGITNSIGATILSGDGNSLDPRNRNWTITETLVVSGALDTIKASGIARTTNPTAVSDGDNQRIALDDLGRQLTRPVQVRDLTLTAYATLTNGTETTLKAAVAGSYLDLIYIMGANNSDAAVTVDIRAVTAGNVMMSIQIPANGTAGIACPVPLPQDETGNNWTADLPDVTGTTVYLTALFSREI